MILLLGSKQNITLSFLAQKAHEMGVDSAHLDAEDICQWVSYNHMIERKGIVASTWHIPVRKGDSWSTELLEPQHVKCVINFLGAHLPAVFDFFEEDDRLFAKFESHAGLLFALTQFPHVVNPPRFGRLCGFAGSLIQQWLRVRQTCLEVETPLFYYGRYQEQDFSKFDPAKTIWSDNIYRTNLWRPHGRHQDEQADDSVCSIQLVYQRPEGAPFMATYAKGRVWINLDLSSKHKFMVKSVVEKLAQDLDLNLFTSLFFYDEMRDVMTFGSVMPAASIEYISGEDRSAFAQHLLQ